MAAIQGQVANLASAVVSKRGVTSDLAVVCVGLLLSAGCGDVEAGSTLVRFQAAKTIAPWRSYDSGADAAADAAALDALTASDSGGRPDAGEPVDAGQPLSDEDAREPEDREPPKSEPVSACSFRVTTKPLGGRYAPKNIGAIWIEREDGKWVKTLGQWAGVRLRYLTTYLAANSTRNTMDAVTSATLRQHTSHEVKWNLEDVDGKIVPDGEYRVRVELTDRSSAGELLSVPFRKSSEAIEIKPADNAHFVEVRLSCS
jgi:hypothetical protein